LLTPGSALQGVRITFADDNDETDDGDDSDDTDCDNDDYDYDDEELNGAAPMSLQDQQEVGVLLLRCTNHQTLFAAAHVLQSSNQCSLAVVALVWS
jgi:hypothetical protein